MTLRPIARAAVLLFAAGSAGLTLPAGAAQWTLDNGWQVNFDSTVSFGVALRTGQRDCRDIGNDNGGCVGDAATPLQASNPAAFSSLLDVLRVNQDDGNLHYKRGQVVSANAQWTSDLYVKATDGWSGLLRGVINHDFAVSHTQGTPLSPAARDFAVSHPRLLDAYVTKEFEVADQQARVRVGNQVLSWGEDLYITGGVNAINPIYLPSAHQPGTPLKNLFIPAPMVSASTSLGSNLGVEAFWQWAWKGFVFDAPGTFFSTADYLGKGAADLQFPSALLGPGVFIPREGDNEPRHRGQGGLALRYKFPDSGDELGVYYLRTSDKVPFLTYRVTGTGANPMGWTSQLDYGTGRDLFGLSYNFQLGDWALGTELSYRPRDGVAIDPTTVIDPANPHYCNAFADFSVAPAGTRCQGWVDTRHWQLHLTGIHILAPSGSLGWLLRALGASEGTLTAETALAYYPRLRLDAGIPYAVTADYKLPTRLSAGMVLAAGVTYPNILGTRASLSPDLAVSQGLSGVAATALPGFVRGAGAAVLGATVDFKTRPETKLRVDFTHNWGGGNSNLMRDRDFMSVSLTTSF
jgi:hypothetical protein